MATRTKFLINALDPEDATRLYEKLKREIRWEEGIRSRSGFTRKAKAISAEELLLGEHPEILECLASVLALLDGDYHVRGVYLNFYEDGRMYTPNHSHRGTQQLVISLGAPRVLVVGRKEYVMSNGSAVLFGGSTHGVPRDPTVSEGRISIATFMTRK